MKVLRTLPAHEWCGTHRRYLLTCDEYEDLLKQSNGRCQIDGTPASAMPAGRLFIDHGPGGRWAVRGLLCISCNSQIGTYVVYSLPGGAREYLARPWWMRRADELGVSAERWPEPVGCRVTDCFGVVWAQDDQGRWQGSNHRFRRSWPELWGVYGPLRLRVCGGDA